jgi:hypothetical protein
MSVLDPVEVADVELWPFDLKGKSKDEIERTLASAEYTVKKKVVNASKLKFVLNEKDIPTAKEIPLPKSYRRRIVPSPIYETRQHPDIRIAQRAATIADLAKIIVERKVQKGLRRTLSTFRQCVSNPWRRNDWTRSPGQSKSKQVTRKRTTILRDASTGRCSCMPFSIRTL